MPKENKETLYDKWINKLKNCPLFVILVLFVLVLVYLLRPFDTIKNLINKDREIEQEQLLNRPYLTATMTPLRLIHSSDPRGWGFSGRLTLQNSGKTEARFVKERLNKKYLKEKVGKAFVNNIWQQLINREYILKDGTFTDKCKNLLGISNFDIVCPDDSVKEAVYNIIYYMSQRYFFITDLEPRRDQVRTIRVQDLGSFPEINTIVPGQENVYIPIGGLMGEPTKLVCVFVKLKYSGPIPDSIYHYVLKMVYVIPSLPNNQQVAILIDRAEYHNKETIKYFEGDAVQVDWKVYLDKPIYRDIWKQ